MDKLDRKPKVLVIEDDPGHQKLLELYIKRSGCSCDCSYDGRTGLEKALTNAYDLILCDINIPEMDGFMVAMQIRDAGNHTPLIAITALQLEGMKRKAIAIGYNDFLEKPIEQAHIEKLLHIYVPIMA